MKMIAAKQGRKIVIEYANQLKILWQDLDHYRVIKTKCPEDVVGLKDFIEQEFVLKDKNQMSMIFLLGLTHNLIKCESRLLASRWFRALMRWWH